MGQLRYMGDTTGDGTGIVSIVGKLLPFIQALIPMVQKFVISHELTQSELVLGERMLDQIPGVYPELVKQGIAASSSFATSHPYSADITDRHYSHPEIVVPMAKVLFTVLFGVRIADGNDLDALDVSVDNYLGLGNTVESTFLSVPLVVFKNHSDIPRAAVERAVMLKKTYYPISTYNNTQWDLSYFQAVPLVAPIPGLEYGTLYNGAGPFGGDITNGVPVQAVQPAATNSSDGSPAAALTSLVTGNKLIWAAAAIALLIILSGNDD